MDDWEYAAPIGTAFRSSLEPNLSPVYRQFTNKQHFNSTIGNEALTVLYRSCVQ